MGYGPLFETMFTGSMFGAGLNRFGVLTYAIGCADRDGMVELNPNLLAAVFGCKTGEIEDAIEFLCSPDKDSRSKEEGGRRLVHEGAFSYRLVNKAKYRELMKSSTKALYNRGYMAGLRAAGKEAPEPEVEKEPEPDPPKKKKRSVRRGEVDFEDVWRVYPRKVGRKAAESAWRNLTVKDQTAASSLLPTFLVHWQRKDPQFIPHFSTWINKRRWEDELDSERGRPPSHMAAGGHEEQKANGEWVYDTFRKEDRDEHGNHSMWEQYADAACEFEPRTAPPFKEWLEKEISEML